MTSINPTRPERWEAVVKHLQSLTMKTRATLRKKALAEVKAAQPELAWRKGAGAVETFNLAVDLRMGLIVEERLFGTGINTRCTGSTEMGLSEQNKAEV